jgi:hypothetical protein
LKYIIPILIVEVFTSYFSVLHNFFIARLILAMHFYLSLSVFYKILFSLSLLHFSICYSSLSLSILLQCLFIFSFCYSSLSLLFLLSASLFSIHSLCLMSLFSPLSVLILVIEVSFSRMLLYYYSI